MSGREPTIGDVLEAIETLHGHIRELEGRLEGRLVTVRSDIMARIDRLQDALTLSREEQLVDQSAILLMRRQIQHLQDRVQTLEENR